MKLITIDFETAYSQEYSLSKLSTDEYVLDPRFQVIGVGVSIGHDEPVWVTENIAEYLHSLDLPNNAVLCWHTQFDGFILTQHYGISAALWLDGLAMARAMLPYLRSHSLGNVAKFMGIGEKGTEVINAKGLRREDFPPHQLAAYGEYCMQDVALTRAIVHVFKEWGFPKHEFEVVDMVTRMFTEPRLVGDADLFYQLYEAEVARKEAALQRAAVDRSVIMSNNKFAEALENLGVSPPTKVSPKTGKVAYAFAKTDKAFTELLEHEDANVQALVAARLGVKTTISETRALRLHHAAKRGSLPVYLNYSGAKVTHRMSGGGAMNWQNLPGRGDGAEIRKGVKAPPGYKVVVGDSSNIELRVAMAAAGQWDVVDKIARGLDLYCDFAGKLYKREITKADAKERLIGKIAMLSLQYGAGAERYREMVRVQGKLTISLMEAQDVVGLYREIHGELVKLWRHCSDVVLPRIHSGGVPVSVDVNGWALTNDKGFGVPGQLQIQYHNLRRHHLTGEWVYTMGREEEVRVYGPKVVENLCIAAGTLVLTSKGWKPIDEVSDSDLVHDGVEFVRHGGLAHKGKKACMVLDGVWLTPDHEVLSDEGWTTASSCQRLHRPDLRGVVGAFPLPLGAGEMAVELPLCLRQHGGESSHQTRRGSPPRGPSELRVHDLGTDARQERHARHVETPGVLGVAQHAGPLPPANAPSVAQLWREGHNCLRALGRKLREFLGRYGRNLRGWADTGPGRQQRAVLAGELPVGDLQHADVEHPENSTGFARRGGGDCAGGQSPHGNRAHHTAVEAGSGLADGKALHPAEVYDILDAGPRQRFVVLGAGGPFIVHNCQYLARLIVIGQTVQHHRRFPVALSVHDEAVCVVEEHLAEECAQHLLACLREAPAWTRGLIPLTGEVGIGDSYGEAK